MKMPTRSRWASPRIAVAAAAIVGLVISGAVSRLTPDGNLVVTLVPGMVAAFVVFGLLRWPSRHLR